MTRFVRSRTVGRALLCIAFTLCFGAALHAQTITDPQIVEFTPSPDHSALDSSGNPIVTSYSLMIYVAGASTPTQTVSLGKPAPDSDGKIRVNFIALLSTPLAVNVTYEGRVSANGPGGSTPSSPSNDFSFTAGCAPIVSPTTQSPGASGGSFNASVTVASTCAWSATSNASWITITAGASGMGNGTV